jgi:hypothetical protein
MSCDVARFTPDILHSYSRLNDFLNEKEIDRHVKRQVMEAGRHPDNNWMGSWKAIPHEVSAVLQVYFALFALAMSYLCFALQLKRMSCQLHILYKITLYDPQPFGYWKFGRDFLAPSINHYSLDAIDLYVQRPLLKKVIRDEKVRLAIHPEVRVIEFDKNTGFCLGESRRFLRDYFKTRDLFENARDHMQALGKQFSWGASAQMALLQKLCPPVDAEEIVGLQENWHAGIAINDDATLHDDAGRCKKIADALQNLSPGAFLLLVSNHAMAFVVEKEGEGYFFDPNLGTVAIHDQAGRGAAAE